MLGGDDRISVVDGLRGRRGVNDRLFGRCGFVGDCGGLLGIIGSLFGSLSLGSGLRSLLGIIGSLLGFIRSLFCGLGLFGGLRRVLGVIRNLFGLPGFSRGPSSSLGLRRQPVGDLGRFPALRCGVGRGSRRRLCRRRFGGCLFRDIGFKRSLCCGLGLGRCLKFLNMELASQRVGNHGLGANLLERKDVGALYSITLPGCRAVLAGADALGGLR